MRDLSPTDLDKFLGNNTPQLPPGAPVPPAAPVVSQSPLVQTSNTLGEGNQLLSQITQLVQGVNQLITSGSDLLNKGVDRKAERIQASGGNPYDDIPAPTRKSNPAPREENTINVPVIDKKKIAEKAYEWFEKTLAAVEEHNPELSVKEMLKNYREEKPRFLEVMEKELLK